MAYSNYKKLSVVAAKFDLEVENKMIFDRIEPIEPSDWLVKSLELASILPASNEKAKSERFISPILLEVFNAYQEKLTLFSGEELNVEPENDLNGACDFFFSGKPRSFFLEAPIVSLAEAKDEDMDYGIAQCAAQMIGAQRFNQKKGKEVKVIWGCSTTAGEWKFLKLIDNKLSIHPISFFVDKLDVLLGVFHCILKDL